MASVRGVATLRAVLWRPVGGESLAAFRVAFGVLMLWEVYVYFSRGWIHRYWIDPVFHFQYLGFSWVKPWPGNGMYVHFAVQGVAAFGVCVGLFYRASAILLWATFTYQFLLEQARYLNHFYVASLFALLLIFVPANAVWSVDALARMKTSAPLAVRNWSVIVMRAQVAIIYAFAGLAKLNGDWLRGEPVRAWALGRYEMPFMKFLVDHEWEVLAVAYGGLAFDLLVVPFLVWRRTRLTAFAVAVTFHMTNGELFRIGVFPWLMIAATTLYFPSDWPRQAWALLAGTPYVAPSPTLRHNGLAASAPRMVLLVVGAYLFVQLAMPLRHLLYPGDVAWTEEGHRFSWRMMLRQKDGLVTFTTVTPTRRDTVVQGLFLRPWQQTAMAVRPDMIQQFARYIATVYGARDGVTPAVYVTARVALNGRPYYAMVDSTADLAAVRRTAMPAGWILPHPDQQSRSVRRP